MNSSGLVAAATRSNASASQKQQLHTVTSPSFLSPRPTPKPQTKLTLSGQPVRKIEVLRHPHGLSLHDKKTSTRTIKRQKHIAAMSTRVLEDISNRRHSGPTPLSHDPTRKLEFPTPVKPKSKGQEEPVQSSRCSSSSSSSDDQGYSSEEADVTVDVATTGNMRVVRESLTKRPALSAARSALAMAPLGLEYHFSITSTVSSVAVAPDGTFLVVGFSNGMVYIYPLTTDSYLFRRGILLDQIMPRGMYTQIMISVVIPQDGKFIFAGVYRGSTDIRAFEVDSITLPSSDALPSTLADVAGAFALPTATVVAHTYSDAKLKGFAAAKSVTLAGSTRTEYRLLCGLGIKNVHMWRFYQRQTPRPEWTWECVFDKQTNGISLEFITFHPTVANQFLSKSEHQNVRIWHLEETYEVADNLVTVRKKAHTDVKQTLDTVAVYGNYAYGGTESLAVVDLHAATRMELDLPLSAKEQRAQREVRNASSLRAWNPRSSRRRGAEDMCAQRHMRTVSKLAGQDAAPFTVGMCSDGSVFYHSPTPEMGLATPLEYIEGYEQFFVDPSLDFQAQFSDLTRVNTSGLLAVLPLSTTDKEQWMIVAANQDQLVVRSLNAFLHGNQSTKEYVHGKSSWKNVMRDIGRADSSVDRRALDKKARKFTPLRHKKVDKFLSRQCSQLEASSTIQEPERKRKRHEKEHYVGNNEHAGELEQVVSKKVKMSLVANDNVVAVTTPRRRSLSTSAASPVVSISSSSGSSNPTTPVHSHPSRVETHVVALKELQWTLPSTIKPEEVTDAVTDLTQLSSRSDRVKTVTKNTHRIKAQTLFDDINDDDLMETEDGRSQVLHPQDDAVIDSPKEVEQEERLGKRAKTAKEAVAKLDKQLDELEKYEPKFVPVPFVCAKSSLLAATMYQYDTCLADVPITDQDDGEATAAVAEQANLMIQFAYQNERLKMNFMNDRERIYKHSDCSCVLHTKKGSTSAMNWRRNVAHDYLKREQLARRHKKQLTTKLQQLHACYAVQIQELLAVQQMQAHALRTRQQFLHLHRQLCHEKPSTAASPVQVSAVPDHLSEAVCLYPNLFYP